MNKQFPLFLFAIAVVLSCNRCKEECDDASNPECPNYLAPVDPCAGAELTSADFVMHQSLYPGTTADTLIQFYHDCVYGKDITLHALQDSCDYHWIIGADHYYTRDVVFEFGFAFINQTIPLTLVVTRTPDIECFPNDNGVDTLTKSVMPKAGCDASIWGKYYGAWEESPLDSFIIELAHDPDDWPHCGDQVRLIGLNPNVPDTCINTSSLLLDNYIEFHDTPGFCYWPLGDAWLDASLNNITIDYSLIEDTQQSEPRLYHIFHGHRIN